jgi:hypothetical protein
MFDFYIFDGVAFMKDFFNELDLDLHGDLGVFGAGTTCCILPLLHLND